MTRESLTIVNQTRYRTEQLRALVQRVRSEMFARDEFKGRRLVVTFKRGRSGCVSGRASVGGGWSRVWLPPPELFSLDVPLIANVIAHELAHNAGMSNERIMRGRSTRFGQAPGWRERYAWAEAMPLEIAAPVAKAKVADDAKLARAAESLATWRSKAKRAATAIRKYQRRVRYYEHRMAARRGGAA